MHANQYIQNKNKAAFLIKNVTIAILMLETLLIMLRYNVTHAQSRDTMRLNDSSFDQMISYQAKDSIHKVLKTKQVHLYGKANIKTEEISMQAGYIMIDLNKKEVFATAEWDKDSNKINYPVFSDGTDQIKASTIRYNLETKKGFIEALAIQQEETFLLMETAKKQANNDIHFRSGRFTTCNLSEPHYHFQLSRAVFIPEKRIVTGPLNLWIKGVPTPLGLPFAVIPQQKKRTHGILFPEFTPASFYGFGIQNIGYFVPINEQLQHTVYGNLYSRGSWGIRNHTDYAKKYGFNGSFDIGFQQFKSGFPNNERDNKLSISWIHRKDLKSNPLWNFSSNVNFISDNQSKNNLDPLNTQYFDNSFNSDIALSRLFPGKPISMGMKLSVRQNALSKNVALTSPIYNLNVTRFFPLKKLVRGNGGFAQLLSRLGMTYNIEAQNRSTFGDSLLLKGNFNAISRQLMNGINQNTTLQTTTAFFKNTVKLTPVVNYTNKINFQQIRKQYDSSTNGTITDTLYKTGMLHEFSAGIQMTTIIYAYYKFIGKKKPVLRHLLTPSVGYRYAPQWNALITTNAGVNQSAISYSPFERSIYSGGNSQTASFLTFGVNNTFELKQKSAKDTLTGYRKIRLIDLLSLNGSYDYNKDSMKLSDLSFNLRLSPANWLNIVTVSNLSPYAWDPISGKTLSDFAFNTNNKIGRFTQTTMTSSFVFASKESRIKLANTSNDISQNWTADYNYFALHPEYLLDFSIPWKLSLSHVYNLTANQIKTIKNPENYQQIQTLVMNGDISFTQRWKLSANINFDVETEKITNARFTLARNMHCWALSFFWTPIGGNKSFLLSIRNTSSIFQDAKIEFRRPPVFL